LAPDDDTLLRPKAAVILDGQAHDLEDGELSGDSLLWTSNLQGPLGSGRQLALPGGTLVPGDHLITLTAVDSDDMVAESSVTILVRYPLYVPVILKN
jgi:hypothetical protein